MAIVIILIDDYSHSIKLGHNERFVPLSAAPVISPDCPLERADKGNGMPEGGKFGVDDWLILAEGKVGTRGVATGMAARFRRGRLCVEDLRGGRPPLPSPDPVPETLVRPRSSELSLLSESEYTATQKNSQKNPLSHSDEKVENNP